MPVQRYSDAEKKQVTDDLKKVSGLENFLLNEIRLARKASSVHLMKGDNNKAVGYAHLSVWLEDFASDLNLNLKDDD